MRTWKGGRGKFSPIVVNVSISDVEIDENIAKTGAIIIGTVVIYQGIKWGVAAVTAAPSGGVSLGLAALLP